MIIPVTFVMVYPMMVTLSVKSMFKGKDYKLQIAPQLINFVLVPMLAYYTDKLFFGGGPEKYGLWAVGLFLIGVLPTSGMTISWTGFARGNKEAAIKMVIFGLVLGALAAPVCTKVFMGATVKVDMLHMFQQIALFVFVPLFGGLGTQYLLKKRYWEHLGSREREGFNQGGIDSARKAIHRRIRETSQKVMREIPYCPLKEENVMAAVGDPVTQIVSLAQEGRFDLVIMGTHGHGKLEKAIIGSVASEVVRTCPNPVMVVRLPGVGAR